MTIKKHCILGASLLLLMTACHTKNAVVGFERTRLLVDQSYDQQTEYEVISYLKPYQQKVDSLMNPIVGQIDHYMVADRPESDLSNLLADIMVWGAARYNEQVDFAVYNIGGIRAALPQGKVSFGNVLDVAPFENKICFLSLSGDKVLKLFKQIAHNQGEGVSKGVELVITKDGKLVSAKLFGQQIVPDRQYRIATLDYLANGNDKLTAFLAKTNVNAPQGQQSNTRYIIAEYLTKQMQQGIVTNVGVEGRIVVQQ